MSTVPGPKSGDDPEEEGESEKENSAREDFVGCPLASTNKWCSQVIPMSSQYRDFHILHINVYIYIINIIVF